MNSDDFLADLMARPLLLERRHDFAAEKLFVGAGANALEIAVVRSHDKPSRAALIDCWKVRRGRRATPVLLVALYPDQAALCGATGDNPPVYFELDVTHVECLCREILGLPDRHAALRYLSQALPSLETDLPGISNEGLLSQHELEKGVPKLPEWETAKPKAAAAIGKGSDSLLKSLGYSIERIDNLTSLLRGGERRAALAVMLRDDESPETGNERFNSLSPVSYALKKADDEDLPWVILTQGSRVRLYATAVDAGVGRRGRTETWIECQPLLLAKQHLPYLWLLYSADALAPNGSLHKILEASQRFAGDLADRLRERIYDQVVPLLARGIVTAQNVKEWKKEELGQIYEMSLIVLFRLLFIAYAEDRDLLPYCTNDAYRCRSLKQKAKELARYVENRTPIAEGDSHWREATLLWCAVAEGNREWGIPAYDGGLFTDDPTISKAGAALADIVLPNTVFEQVLRQLLVVEILEGHSGPVDFRSLGVREFGTIYEGLLESELAVAETDLAYDRHGVYAPVRPRQKVAVVKGEVYLHNRSGARKSSGSYYTKPFAVEHLLENALEPALKDHFVRLDRMNDADATRAFFDFRVADIAMGSGHFLVGAIDRIERRMVDWQAKRRLPGISGQLAALRNAALSQLGEAAKAVSIEDSQLLRRLIARRCIYGVDLNALAVQLARLAVWIHSFVPGLPLSFLDHNLVRGNALVGVGAFEEIRKVFDEEAGTLFEADADVLLGAAQKPLRRLANINDETLADIVAARKAVIEAQQAVGDTERLCDLIVARRLTDNPKVKGFMFQDWDKQSKDPRTLAAAREAKLVLAKLHALHFPVAFPEVFLRVRPGFDVILGNPPWDEVTVEEDSFWARHFPDLRHGRAQLEQEAEKARLRQERPDLVAAHEAERKEAEYLRKALTSGAYPGMGTGDPDLYKAFCWRFWHLAVEKGGSIGVVLPRSALVAQGSMEFRKTMFERAVRFDCVALKNRNGWVFDDVTPQYTICLLCVSKGTPINQPIYLLGPFESEAAFREAVKAEATTFDCSEVRAWDDNASLPLLPKLESVAVLSQLRKAPRLDLNIVETGGGVGWRARPDRELDATNQKAFMVFDCLTNRGVPDPTPNFTLQRRKS